FLHFLVNLFFFSSNLLPTPENVTLLSNNFNHILIWSPGRGTPQGTVYSINVERRRVKTNKTILDISKYIFCFVCDSAIIGPPAVTMSGCGNCFNISFSLPVREGLWNRTNFYKGIVFYIRLKKAGEEKLYNCSVKNLQLGGNYCVQAQPHINVNENTRPSDWFCAFTSTVEERGGKVSEGTLKLFTSNILVPKCKGYIYNLISIIINSKIVPISFCLTRLL
uniref:Fibronectin type-III domain-containing protein n=1 Tax=Astyanax mexicanus TaxID=7994 RepID=A0A8B9HDA9_ASTMX